MRLSIPRLSRRQWLSVTAPVALFLGVAMSAAPIAAQSAPTPTIVLASDFMFSPASLTVQAGSSVTWTNKDDEPHTVVSDSGLFRSGALDTGESFSFKFDKPGTYRYTCSIHPRMVGTILVQ
jgi:plastocyanin